MEHKRYRITKGFKVRLEPFNRIFYGFAGKAVYISITRDGSYGHYRARHLTQIFYSTYLSLPLEEFDQISQYLELVSQSETSQKVAKDDHEGMIYNPIINEWRWI